eukprot:scaffold1148_cov148-Skeletonema_menzelii.AAC.7
MKLHTSRTYDVGAGSRRIGRHQVSYEAVAFPIHVGAGSRRIGRHQVSYEALASPIRVELACADDIYFLPIRAKSNDTLEAPLCHGDEITHCLNIRCGSWRPEVESGVIRSAARL